MDYDLYELVHCVVPNEHYQELLDMVDIIGYPESLIYAIIKNYPHSDYTYDNMSETLLMEMAKLILESVC